MIQEKIVVGPLQCNCALLACEKTKEAVLIDPGDEAPKIIAKLSQLGVKVKYLLHTHAHFDHVGATGKMKEIAGGEVCLHKDDKPLYDNLPLQGKLFGFPMPSGPAIEKFIQDGEELVFGENKIEVIHTPGHSPGGVCFRVFGGKEKEQLFSGDSLFQDSVGRTDLWGGNQDLLLKSLRDRVLVLEGEMKVHPGHGPSTTIAHEKKYNPFLS